ncbi:hypothetical protein [Bauldia litoralis]|uniref:hypothetical protein n=1 Tax=Bauldia litoralis TaxID=665467 RepID=UPI00326682F6
MDDHEDGHRADDREAPDVIADLATRGFIGRPGPTILAATGMGLLAMTLSFAFDSPMLVSMAALFAGILLVLGIRAGDMRYRLTGEGLGRSFRPLLWRYLGLRSREQFFRFSDMRFFRRDRDWSRYRAEEVESVTIGVRRPPFRVVIHDMIDKPSFGAFADVFERLAGQGETFVERRPGFYESVWAILLTALFVAVAVVLIGFFVAGALSPTGVFRLLIVIIPGVIYMVWRVSSARFAARQDDPQGKSEATG